MRVIVDPQEWRAALSKAVAYDFYHTSDYHELVSSDDAEPHLFVFEGSSADIFLPLIISQRKLANRSFADATSVYGYAGPVATQEEVPSEDCDAFVRELRRSLLEMNVVSLFSRLHPLLDNSHLVAGAGVTHHSGKTVSIDLTESPDIQWSHYRKNHQRDIRKLKKSGVLCTSTRESSDLAAFSGLYNDTMLRLGAGAGYFFSMEYFEKMMSATDFEMQLFMCKHEGVSICGGLFSVCNGVIQYHLGGTHSDFFRMAPTKLLFDTVRCWGSECGLKVLHLGGGLGGTEDSLYRFKEGFSKRTHDFQLWNWVLDQKKYGELEMLRRKQLQGEGGLSIDENYFPSYRAPATDMAKTEC